MSMEARPLQAAGTVAVAGGASVPTALTDLVQPERVRLWEDAFRVLHADVDGKVYDDVRPRRLFPLSGKADYVSFMTDRDHEVLLLARPDRLDRESRKALEQAFDRLYYRAIITRVDHVSETMGVSYWQVMTDRGYARFEVVDRQQHIRILPGGRFIITDADGNRFEIPDFGRLDARSQALIETET